MGVQWIIVNRTVAGDFGHNASLGTANWYPGGKSLNQSVWAVLASRLEHETKAPPDKGWQVLVRHKPGE